MLLNKISGLLFSMCAVSLCSKMVFKKRIFFIHITFISIMASSQAIIDPSHQETKYYTPGIKTKNWKNEHVITHQNYSKVFFHNNSSGSVFNGHQYGKPDNKTNEPEETSTAGTSHDILQILSEEHIRPVIHKRKIAKALEVYEKCPPGSTGQFVYHLSCNQFLNCWKGRGNVQNCAPGTLFNPKTLECDYPDKVECVTGPRQNTVAKIRSAKSITQPRCPEDFTGLIPNYTDCSKFINCNNGQSMSQDCPPGTLFDTNRNLCDFPQNAVCFNGQNEVAQSGYQYRWSAKSLSYAYGGSSHTKCDPSTQNCYLVLPNSQYPYYTAGHSQKNDQIVSSAGRQFIYSASGYSEDTDHGQHKSHSTNCDLSTNNCGGNVFGSGSNKGAGQTQDLLYITSGCNPQTENCGILHGSSISCVLGSQNCEQQGPSNRQTQTYGACDPNRQDCSTKQYGQAVLLTGEVACNPNIENCGRTTIDTHSAGTREKACDPNIHNCGSYGIKTAHNTRTYLRPGDTSRIQYGHFPWNGYQYRWSPNFQSYAYGGSSHTKCDPPTQNCYLVLPNSQYPYYTAGHSQKNDQIVSSAGRQFIYSASGYSEDTDHGQHKSHSTNCDLSTNNCGGNVFGSGSNKGAGLTQALLYITSGCNPQTENCGVLHGSSISCVLGSQNCEQQGPSNRQTQTYGACDPNRQDCSTKQYGQAVLLTGEVACNPNIENCGRTTIDTHSAGTREKACDPNIHNCGIKTAHNTRTYLGPGNAPRIQYGHYPWNGQQACDPLIQNCGQYHQYGQKGVPEQHGQNRCDPNTQNCGQYGYKTIDAPNTGQNSNKGCDPQNPNCAQQGIKVPHQTVQPCNPLYDNCAPTIRLPQNSLEGKCNPLEKNCSPSGRREPGILNQNSKSNDCIPGQNCDTSVNYKKICNINDRKCRSESHTIVSKDTKNQRPKCPEGFQGITKHPTHCRKFLNCANGQTFIQDCAPGTLFNEKLGNCDFPYNVDCDEAKAESPVEEGNDDYDSYTESYSSTVPSSTWGGQYEDHSQYSQSEKSTWQKQYEDHALQYGFNAGHGSIRPSPQETKVQPEYHVKPITERNRGKSGILIRPVTPHYLPAEDQSESISSFSDYMDVFDPKQQKYINVHSTTPRSAARWPTPIPTTDADADYIFEYDDGEPITLKPESIIYAEYKKKKVCGKGDFYCSSKMCITKAMVCDGHRDCENGRDETGCEEFIGRFTANKNAHLEVLEKQRWINVSYTTCAMLCIQSNTFNCRSFNYRKYDRTCFLSDLNVGLTGALRVYNPFDYYELSTGTIDCSDKAKYFECKNKKCLIREQLCDGTDDCGDRQDEKNCSPQDFGYSIKLAGAEEKNQGRIEVTAFGKTGYICDDQIGLQEANVICKELGFEMGAIDIKGQSYFAEDIKENNTLYMMDDLKCFGNEKTLLDCNFAGWGIHDCQDLEIVGVVCKTPQEMCGQGFWKCATTSECVPLTFMCDDLNDCSDDSDEDNQYCQAPTEIRLVNGSSYNEGRLEGRLEVSHYGIWGTVCDDDFNEDAAKFVCKRLGYKGASTVRKDGYFGAGSGPIWLDQVSCTGDELDLKACTTWGWGEHNCDHNEDVGVVCDDTEPEVEVQRHVKLPEDGDVTGLANVCGLRKDNQFLENDLIQARVVKGATARKGDYPWQAAIRAKSRDKTAHWCGAVIVGRRWVLTAAHCIHDYPKGSFVIAAGDYNVDEDEGTEQLRYIEEYFIHEQFRKGGHKINNDIALVKLKGRGFEFNDDVQAICLADTDAVYDEDLNCTISGYGSIKSGVAAYSHKMMAAWVPILTKEVCNMPHIYDSVLTDGMICAGLLDGGIDSCDGDSGGPLACLDQGFFTLYGITSWGHRCGFANKPGVYVKVAHYRQWIQDTIEKHS